LKVLTVTSLGFMRLSTPRENTGAVLRVAAQPGDRRKGVVSLGAFSARCALGRGGIGVLKREGDGKTPRAAMPVLGGFVRAGRWPAAWRAPWLASLPDDARRSFGWCDAPQDANYNRPVRLPFAASHETLLRDDGLYDCVIVLGWNIAPRARLCGSAIFMHLARDGFAPTEGCIALSRRDMARLLRVLRPGMRVHAR
jgi:L,D-peptidoglycan transpeptidase YkuD (ErfK/YbiS/YcfS/YnhG family)